MPGKSFIPNPNSKGQMIERREFYVDNAGKRDADFERMCKVIPFVIGKEPVGRGWWQRTMDNTLVFLIGVPTKTTTERRLRPMIGDRMFYPGDEPDTFLEGRSYASQTHYSQMCRVQTERQVDGIACMVWWEVANPEKPDEGSATLCVGVRHVAGAAVKLANDDLDQMTKAALLTKAGEMGLGDVDEQMEEGEIIARIRAKKAQAAAAKAPKTPPKTPAKTKEPVAV